jgi:hypothetical protein
MNWLLYQRISGDHWRPLWGSWATEFAGGALIYMLHVLPPALAVSWGLSRMRTGRSGSRRLLWWAFSFCVMMMVSNLTHLLPRHSRVWLVLSISVAIVGIGWLIYTVRLAAWLRRS